MRVTEILAAEKEKCLYAIPLNFFHYCIIVLLI